MANRPPRKYIPEKCATFSKSERGCSQDKLKSSLPRTFFPKDNSFFNDSTSFLKHVTVQRWFNPSMHWQYFVSLAVKIIHRTIATINTDQIWHTKPDTSYLRPIFRVDFITASWQYQSFYIKAILYHGVDILLNTITLWCTARATLHILRCDHQTLISFLHP